MYGIGTLTGGKTLTPTWQQPTINIPLAQRKAMLEKQIGRQGTATIDPSKPYFNTATGQYQSTPARHGTGTLQSSGGRSISDVTAAAAKVKDSKAAKIGGKMMIPGLAIGAVMKSDVGKGLLGAGLAAAGIGGAVALAKGLSGRKGRGRRGKTTAVKNRVKTNYLSQARSLSYSNNPKDWALAEKYLAKARMLR